MTTKAIGGPTPDDLPGEQESLELLGRAQDGDRDALQQLLQRYEGRLLRIVRIQLGRSSLRRWHDSTDLVQEAFAAALPHLDALRVRSRAGLLAWLTTIARHQLLDAWDHQHAAKRDVRRDVFLDGASARSRVDPPAAEGGDPGAVAERAEAIERLDAAVAALPDDQRQVVLLHDYFGEPWPAVAEQMGRSQGAARMVHQRAKKALREALRDHAGDGPRPGADR